MELGLEKEDSWFKSQLPTYLLCPWAGNSTSLSLL